MGYFDRNYQRELVKKYNESHDDRGRFSSSDTGSGPDRRAEMANTPERHQKASTYHTDRSQLFTKHAPAVATMHLKSAQAHRTAAASGTYDDRRLARDLSVYTHAMEDARS